LPGSTVPPPDSGFRQLQGLEHLPFLNGWCPTVAQRLLTITESKTSRQTFTLPRNGGRRHALTCLAFTHLARPGADTKCRPDRFSLFPFGHGWPRACAYRSSENRPMNDRCGLSKSSHPGNLMLKRDLSCFQHANCMRFRMASPNRDSGTSGPSFLGIGLQVHEFGNSVSPQNTTWNPQAR
jgi:hypothetical protein